MNLIIRVDNQRLIIPTNLKYAVEGSQKFVRFKFNFSKNWYGLKVFAQFGQNGKAYNVYLDSENCVYLPTEIIAGECTLMLYGSYNDVIATSNYLTLRIDDSLLVENADSTAISESLYNQLVTQVEGFSNRIDNVMTDPLFIAQVNQATSTKVEELVQSGAFAGMVIGDNSIAEIKLDNDLKEKINNKEVITPQIFGAKGDGVTNDTEAFNQAINIAKLKNGILYIPDGVYNTDFLNLENITILGASDKPKFLKGFKVGQNVIIKNIIAKSINKYNSIVKNINIENCQLKIITFNDCSVNNLRVNNCVLDGEKESFMGIGLVCKCTKDTQIKNVFITNCTFINYAALSCIGRRKSETTPATHGYRNIFVDNCSFDGKLNAETDSDITITFDSPDILPVDNTANPICGDVSISNCIIKGGYFGLENAGCDRFNVVNCDIDTGKNLAISWSRGIDKVVKSVISGCNIRGKCLITGNQIKVSGNNIDGVLIVRGCDKSTTITNNTISKTIQCDGASPVISENIISGGTTFGVIQVSGGLKANPIYFFNNACFGVEQKGLSVISGDGTIVKTVVLKNNTYNGRDIVKKSIAQTVLSGGFSLYNTIPITITCKNKTHLPVALFKITWSGVHGYTPLGGEINLCFGSASIAKPKIFGTNIDNIQINQTVNGAGETEFSFLLKDKTLTLDGNAMVKVEAIFDNEDLAQSYTIKPSL